MWIGARHRRDPLLQQGQVPLQAVHASEAWEVRVPVQGKYTDRSCSNVNAVNSYIQQPFLYSVLLIFSR